MNLLRETSFARYHNQWGVEQGIEQGATEEYPRRSGRPIRCRCVASYTRRIENVDDVKRLEQLRRGAVQAASLERLVNCRMRRGVNLFSQIPFARHNTTGQCALQVCCPALFLPPNNVQRTCFNNYMN